MAANRKYVFISYFVIVRTRRDMVETHDLSVVKKTNFLQSEQVTGSKPCRALFLLWLETD